MTENHEGAEQGNSTPFSNLLLAKADPNFKPEPGEKQAIALTLEFLNYLIRQYGFDTTLEAVLQDMAGKVARANKTSPPSEGK